MIELTDLTFILSIILAGLPSFRGLPAHPGLPGTPGERGMFIIRS
jgi:hypothetical protein